MIPFFLNLIHKMSSTTVEGDAATFMRIHVRIFNFPKGGHSEMGCRTHAASFQLIDSGKTKFTLAFLVPQIWLHFGLLEPN
jgi:hypothetical protein